MTKLIGIVSLQIASFASVMGLYLTLVPGPERPIWHVAILALVFASYALSAYDDISRYVRARPTICSTPEQIRRFMYRWISRGGRVVIFSRDMSWVDQHVRNLLTDKARRNELILCLERRIPVAQELEQAGAEIVTYKSLGHVPSSRFTIVNFERQDAQVAVGGQVHGKHLIHEFRRGEHPFFAVADDLARLMINFGRLEGHNVSQD